MSKGMTPFGLVRAECCNFIETPSFTGCLPRDDQESSVCYLRQKKRCRHFEVVLLPLGGKQGLKMGQEYLHATNIYRERHKIGVSTEANRCECGALRPGQSQYCKKCAVIHRRESQRNRTKKHRAEIGGGL